MTVSPAKITRTLTVSQRLLTLGVAAVAGLGTVLAVGAYENRATGTALTEASRIQADVAKANELRIANLDMVLAAMDTIVDKDEGKVVPERMEIMKKAIAELKANADLVTGLSATVGKPELAKDFIPNVDAIEKAMIIDLDRLVTSKADETEFSKIDDTIDNQGEAVAKTLKELATAGSELAKVKVADAQAEADFSLYAQVAVSLFFLLVLAILFPFHVSAIRRGIKGITDSLGRMSAGDYRTPVDGVGRSDELGAIARANDLMRQQIAEKNALDLAVSQERQSNEEQRQRAEAEKQAAQRAFDEAIDELADGLARLAAGDFTVSLTRPFTQDLERVRQDFNKTANTLNVIIAEVANNTSSIQNNSEQMRVAADDLAKRTEQQAASLEQTSAALDEITATMRTASERAEEARAMVSGTKGNAEDSSAVVTKAMSAMQRIEQASSEIGKIINVIDEIAFQTNLLALNAGVEAARAGDAGKGFAVVAQEVRELAGRAAGAAKDIKTLVARSSDEVKTGVNLVTETGEVLTHIARDVAKINDIVEAIATSSREQSVGINEINTAINRMDQMTQKNAAMVEETNAASHTLAQDTGNLTQLIRQFQIKDGARTTAQQTAPAAWQAAPRQASAPKPESRPAPASAAARPVISPAKSLVNKLAGAFNQKQATAPAASAAADNWEEF